MLQNARSWNFTLNSVCEDMLDIAFILSSISSYTQSYSISSRTIKTHGNIPATCGVWWTSWVCPCWWFCSHQVRIPSVPSRCAIDIVWLLVVSWNGNGRSEGVMGFKQKINKWTSYWFRNDLEKKETNKMSPHYFAIIVWWNYWRLAGHSM